MCQKTSGENTEETEHTTQYLQEAIMQIKRKITMLNYNKEKEI